MIYGRSNFAHTRSQCCSCFMTISRTVMILYMAALVFLSKPQTSPKGSFRALKAYGMMLSINLGWLKLETRRTILGRQSNRYSKCH
ncbi:hypothetical protein FB192DRAFT_1398824 [Mucor lusitanicus]|uniref:Uncharacterized protein n=1 Tax=Mucor circinelloides f. lusitanicus TaxID=29924 RepID=A0A8H4B9Z1_MUCCL|nr:hypothetical protein FB192DRAFT_1398824 [Mucor lusitanicus]